MPVSTIQNASLASGVPASANMPTGSVLQVVNATLQVGQNSTTSTSFVSTPLTASITPKSSTSKILILVNGIGLVSSTSFVTAYTIYRNATNLGSSTGFTFCSTTGSMGMSMSTLDSPATTSSTAYTVYFRVNGGTGYFGDTLGGVSPFSSITLMEIAG
jgi:hypothetical protein